MIQTSRVLVVDDSVVFRSQIRGSLEKSDRIEVVGVANHGKIALQKLAQTSVDVITLDMEMPEMDGLETIKAIKQAGYKCRIIVFSSQTKRGSEAALSALSLGADDFLAKPDLSLAAGVTPEELIGKELVPKVLQFTNPQPLASSPGSSAGLSGGIGIASKPTTSVARASVGFSKRDLASFKPAVIVIGSSTGGPQALEKVLVSLPKPLRCPILITQHMPPVFTASLAQRLAGCSGVSAAEGRDMEELQANRIYVAPGDFHMKLIKVGEKVMVSLDKDPPRNSVRPAVDTLFESAANIYKSNCFGVVLTGMGEDGLVGCRSIKGQGGAVAIQNKDSCVVFGMPGAVYQDGCYDDAYDPDRMNYILKQMTTLQGM